MGPVGDTIGDLIPDLIGTHGLASDPDEILLGLGANLHRWWEPRPAQVTLNGGNIQQIDPLAGAVALAQLTVGNQPELDLVSAPYPQVHIQDVARFMTGSLGIGSGSRTGLYLVAHLAVNDGSGYAIRFENAAGQHLWAIRVTAATSAEHNARFTDGLQAPVATITDAPHLLAVRPLSTGALLDIDGVSESPGYTGTAALADISQATIGIDSGLDSAAGTRIAAIIMTAEPVAAIDSVVRQYVAARFGLSV